jgi:peptidoglycan-associated lipoprotein
MIHRSGSRSWLVAIGCPLVAAVLAGCGANEPRPQSPADVAVLTSARARDVEEPRTVAAVSVAPEVQSLCSLPTPTQAPRFDFASTRPTAELDRVLEPLVSCVKSGPLAGKKLRLVGRADPRGSAEYNMALGQSRADTVALFLRQRGVPSEALLPTSRGELDATGTEESGWVLDRRVDIELASP